MCSHASYTQYHSRMIALVNQEPCFDRVFSILSLLTIVSSHKFLQMNILQKCHPSVSGPEMSLIKKPSGFSQNPYEAEWILANVYQAEWILAKLLWSRVDSRQTFKAEWILAQTFKAEWILANVYQAEWILANLLSKPSGFSPKLSKPSGFSRMFTKPSGFSQTCYQKPSGFSQKPLWSRVDSRKTFKDEWILANVYQAE